MDVSVGDENGGGAGEEERGRTTRRSRRGKVLKCTGPPPSSVSEELAGRRCPFKAPADGSLRRIVLDSDDKVLVGDDRTTIAAAAKVYTPRVLQAVCRRSNISYLYVYFTTKIRIHRIRRGPVKVGSTNYGLRRYIAKTLPTQSLLDSVQRCEDLRIDREVCRQGMSTVAFNIVSVMLLRVEHFYI